jgi:hypothetical protein
MAFIGPSERERDDNKCQVPFYLRGERKGGDLIIKLVLVHVLLLAKGLQGIIIQYL